MSQERPEAVLSSQTVYQGRVVNLRVDTVRLPDGGTARREVVEHAPVVAIVAVAETGHLVLVRQYRLPVGRWLLEIPAGGIEPGETPQEAVQRELQEETGYRAAKLEPWGGFYVAPGYCQEYIHLFLATQLQESRLTADADEAIQVVHLSLAEALRRVASGDICDAKSIIGILTLAHRGLPA